VIAPDGGDDTAETNEQSPLAMAIINERDRILVVPVDKKALNRQITKLGVGLYLVLSPCILFLLEIEIQMR
jgi:hypothetical protein